MSGIAALPRVVVTVFVLWLANAVTFAADDEVHLTFIAPPAGSCSDLVEECVSAIGDFSAGIVTAVELAESQVNQVGGYLHGRSLNIQRMQQDLVGNGVGTVMIAIAVAYSDAL